MSDLLTELYARSIVRQLQKEASLTKEASGLAALLRSKLQEKARQGKVQPSSVAVGRVQPAAGNTQALPVPSKTETPPAPQGQQPAQGQSNG